MPKTKCIITDIIPIKKHKQNPIIGKHKIIRIDNYIDDKKKT